MTKPDLLADHIQRTNDRWMKGLSVAKFDAVWIAAGQDHLHFQDDHGPAFKAHPFFTQLVDPKFAHAGAQCLLKPGQRPKLFLLQPTDYWHAPTPLPEYLGEHLDIEVFDNPAALEQACRAAIGNHDRCAYVGEDLGNESLGVPNDAGLLSYMNFHRARKTPYEIELMRNASIMGARGHRAAEAAFRAHGSEFEIHMAYLNASAQTDLEVPYGNIVALNEHGATLHYQLQEREKPEQHRSLLIDAGGNYQGYASDITRTYAMDNNSRFAALIQLMQQHQDTLLDAVGPDKTFAELHVLMHTNLASILVEADLVDCSAEEAFSQGLTEKFCPHGLGHLLGVQVHDVGGHLANEKGETAPPPDNYPSLRFTRQIEEDHVFTIEPGLYFIDPLLAELKAAKAPVNWAQVDALRGFGGIRLEDNVRVLGSGHENLTRDAFAQIEQHEQ